MKNYFFYILGLVILVITVWLTTMAGIKLNQDKNETEQIYIICHKTN